jgi:hypothetical protein
MAEVKCEKCGEVLVCRCGETESSRGWPCDHGGCWFECPVCDDPLLVKEKEPEGCPSG